MNSSLYFPGNLIRLPVHCTRPTKRTFTKFGNMPQSRGLQAELNQSSQSVFFCTVHFFTPAIWISIKKTPAGSISDSESRLCIDLQGRDSRTNVNLVPEKASLPRGGGGAVGSHQLGLEMIERIKERPSCKEIDVL